MYAAPWIFVNSTFYKHAEAQNHTQQFSAFFFSPKKRLFAAGKASFFFKEMSLFLVLSTFVKISRFTEVPKCKRLESSKFDRVWFGHADMNRQHRHRHQLTMVKYKKQFSTKSMTTFCKIAFIFRKTSRQQTTRLKTMFRTLRGSSKTLFQLHTDWRIQNTRHPQHE